MPESVVEVALFLGLPFLAFWRPFGWLMMICGLGMIGVSLQIAGDDPTYGLPYLFIGIGVFLIGAIRRRILGR